LKDISNGTTSRNRAKFVCRGIIAAPLIRKIFRRVSGTRFAGLAGLC
jgi:hypothetical protein